MSILLIISHPRLPSTGRRSKSIRATGSYGNLNSTVIGAYAKPTVRFPGSGGANDFASLCWRTLIMTQHDRRRFTEKLDFL
ncbi:MAG: CoA-transferase, partial [Verrucomicrobiota bacterium]